MYTCVTTCITYKSTRFIQHLTRHYHPELHYYLLPSTSVLPPPRTQISTPVWHRKRIIATPRCCRRVPITPKLPRFHSPIRSNHDILWHEHVTKLIYLRSNDLHKITHRCTAISTGLDHHRTHIHSHQNLISFRPKIQSVQISCVPPTFGGRPISAHAMRVLTV